MRFFSIQVFLFIYFLGVIANAPPITAEKIVSVAKIPMVQQVLW